MNSIHPISITGRWREGYVLDYHTLDSVCIGHDEYGHPQFETKRSDVGELLYRLKYRSDTSVVPQLLEFLEGFLRSLPWFSTLNLIVSVPASRKRALQPTYVIGEALGSRLGLPFAHQALQKIKDVPELKNVYDYAQRLKLLEGAHEVVRGEVEGRTILLLDDLFRSGATMNDVATLLYEQGRAVGVYALAITRTRRNR